VLLVARSTLGTINHTLLSIEALRRRGLPLAGVVLNGPETPHNRAAIERYGEVNVIAEIPWLPEVTRTTLLAIEPELDLQKLARTML
jgi:dethiobiotin synthetase